MSSFAHKKLRSSFSRGVILSSGEFSGITFSEPTRKDEKKYKFVKIIFSREHGGKLISQSGSNDRQYFWAWSRLFEWGLRNGSTGIWRDDQFPFPHSDSIPFQALRPSRPRFHYRGNNIHAFNNSEWWRRCDVIIPHLRTLRDAMFDDARCQPQTQYRDEILITVISFIN